MKKKLLAISSGGGHWIQLLRLLPSFEDTKVSWCSTSLKMADEISGPFFLITDSNFNTKLKLVKTFIDAFKIVKKVRPDIVVSTGAAPGIICILWGKIFGAKTLWVDSIANAETLSISGKIAVHLADKVLTQWEILSDGEKVLYYGAVI